MTTAYGIITEGSGFKLIKARSRIWKAVNVFLLLIVVVCGASFRARAAVTINGAQKFQMIDGFGVDANSQIWTNHALEPVIDALIDQCGMTQFRVIMGNGNWEQTNDNSDANSMNWSYYNPIYSAARFQGTWNTMAYLNQRGITVGAVPKVSGPVALWMGGLSLKAGYENEYAETVASMLYYARNTQGLQFTEVQPDNEPDSTQAGVKVSGAAQYVTVLHDLALQLNAVGMSDVRFSAPDLAYTDTNWFAAIMNDSLVMGKIANFDIHAYQGGAGNPSGAYNFLQQSAFSSTHLWASEFNVWCASCESGSGGDNSWSFAQGTAGWLHYLLTQGISAGMVFEAYDSQFPDWNSSTGQSSAPTWSYWGLFAVNTNTSPYTYTPRKGFYTVAQVAKFVRPGAQRIGTSGSTSTMTVLAFYNTNNSQLTITGVNSNSAASTLSATMTGLPTIPTLDFYYTTSSTNLYHAPQVTVTNGAFSVVVPGSSVFTLTYSNAPPNVPPHFLTPSMQNGSVVHTLVATPGATYQILTSSNLVGWTTLTNLVVTNSMTQFIDPNANNSLRNFYRAVLLP